MKLVFGDIVIVEGDNFGVVVKNWGIDNHGNEPKVEVYVRNYRGIKEYPISQVERYQVRHKDLEGDDIEYQHNAEIEP